jgi:exosortase D (VPLPA-CTERM-specific)
MRSNVDALRVGDKSELLTRPSPRRLAWISGLTLCAAVLFTYADVIRNLAGQWSTNDVYSYAYLIPFISLYLVWLQRHRLLNIQPSPNYIVGSMILLGGLSALVVGQAASVLVIQELSIIVTMTGVFLFLMGWPLLKALWVPIAYLLFMIPIWDIVTNRLHSTFQLVSAILGVTLLNGLGIPAYRHAQYIDLPSITLEVAQVCSGVNYLIAVVAIGIPLAYLFLQGWLRKILLVGSAVIIAIVSNGVRIALIGAGAYYSIGGDIHGPFHVLQGLFVSMIGYGVLFLGLWFLSPPGSRAADVEVRSAGNSETSNSDKMRRVISYKAVATLAALFLFTGAYLHLSTPEAFPLKKEFHSFPLVIGEWEAIELGADHSVYPSLGVDRELSRTYRRSTGEIVRIYIGYYAYQKQGREIISYKTDALHSGAAKISVTFDSRERFDINRTVQKSERENRTVLFWYQLNGRVISDRMIAKAYTAWDSLIRGRSNGAIVIVTSEIADQTSGSKISQADQEFIRAIDPLLRDYLP